MVIHGSPKGKCGNTFQFTEAFLSEMKDIEQKDVVIKDADINHCKGCLYCFTQNPGVCVIHDDVKEILNEMKWADLCIWSFPLFTYDMPSKTKALLDRMLPLSSLSMKKTKSGGVVHQALDPIKTKNIIISSCGFPIVNENYEGLKEHMHLYFGEALKGFVLIPEGNLMLLAKREPQLLEFITDKLNELKEAGKEFMRKGVVDEEMQKKLSIPMIPPEKYMEMVNYSAEKAKMNKLL